MSTRKPTKTGDVADPREVEAHANKRRPKRRPLTTTYNLSLPEGILKKGFEYRWILDRPDKILNYEAAWWESVRDDSGKVIKKPSKGGEYLILYRIKSKYFNEDREINRKRTIDILRESAQLKNDDPNAIEYVPEGHDAVLKIS